MSFRAAIGVANILSASGSINIVSQGVLKLIDLNNTPVTAAYNTTLTVASGTYVLYRCLANFSLTIAPPTTPHDGDQVRFWITASGGVGVAVTLNAAIVIPTSSTFVNGFTIPVGGKSKFLLEYDATRAVWELTQFISGF